MAEICVENLPEEVLESHYDVIFSGFFMIYQKDGGKVKFVEKLFFEADLRDSFDDEIFENNLTELCIPEHKSTGNVPGRLSSISQVSIPQADPIMEDIFRNCSFEENAFTPAREENKEYFFVMQQKYFAFCKHLPPLTSTLTTSKFTIILCILSKKKKNQSQTPLIPSLLRDVIRFIELFFHSTTLKPTTDVATTHHQLIRHGHQTSKVKSEFDHYHQNRGGSSDHGFEKPQTEININRIIEIIREFLMSTARIPKEKLSTSSSSSSSTSSYNYNNNNNNKNEQNYIPQSFTLSVQIPFTLLSNYKICYDEPKTTNLPTLNSSTQNSSSFKYLQTNHMKNTNTQSSNIKHAPNIYNLRYISRLSTNVFVMSYPNLCTFPSPNLNINPNMIIKKMNANKMVKLFLALIFEKKIIFLSSNRSLMTNFVLFCQHILYPFCWQGLIIPLLSKSEINYLYSPKPYIIGMEISLFEEKFISLEGTLIINLDTKHVISNYLYEVELLSISERNINLIRSQLQQYKSDSQYRKDLRYESFWRIFRTYFISLLSNYDDYFDLIERKESTYYQFNMKKFLRAETSQLRAQIPPTPPSNPTPSPSISTSQKGNDLNVLTRASYFPFFILCIEASKNRRNLSSSSRIPPSFTHPALSNCDHHGDRIAETVGGNHRNNNNDNDNRDHRNDNTIIGDDDVILLDLFESESAEWRNDIAHPSFKSNLNIINKPNMTTTMNNNNKSALFPSLSSSAKREVTRNISRGDNNAEKNQRNDSQHDYYNYFVRYKITPPPPHLLHEQNETFNVTPLSLPFSFFHSQFCPSFSSVDDDHAGDDRQKLLYHEPVPLRAIGASFERPSSLNALFSTSMLSHYNPQMIISSSSSSQTQTPNLVAVRKTSNPQLFQFTTRAHTSSSSSSDHHSAPAIEGGNGSAQTRSVSASSVDNNNNNNNNIKSTKEWQKDKFFSTYVKGGKKP